MNFDDDDFDVDDLAHVFCGAPWQILVLLLCVCGVVWLASCAAAPAQAASKNATMAVLWELDDFDDIPAERCEPALRGMFLSYPGGNRILNDEHASDKACATRVLAAETGQKLAEARCPQCAADHDWAIVGKVGVGVTATGAVVGIITGIIEAITRASAKVTP